jgi:WD40 repeat protein
VREPDFEKEIKLALKAEAEQTIPADTDLWFRIYRQIQAKENIAPAPKAVPLLRDWRKLTVIGLSTAAGLAMLFIAFVVGISVGKIQETSVAGDISTAIPQPSVAGTTPDPTKLLAPVFTLSAHTGTVTAIAWSPDGTYLATGSADKTVKIWDSKRNLVKTLNFDNPVTSLSWSSDGKRLAIAAGRAFTYAMNLPGFPQIGYLAGNFKTVIFSPKGNQVLILGEGVGFLADEVFLVQGDFPLNSADSNGTLGVWSPSGLEFATTNKDNKAVYFWRASDFSHSGGVKPYFKLNITGGYNDIKKLDWSPDGAWLAVQREYEYQGKYIDISLWTKTNNTIWSSVNFELSNINTYKYVPKTWGSGWSPGSKVIGFKDDADKLHMLEYGGKISQVLDGETVKGISSGEWSPDGKYFGAGDNKGIVQLWEVNSANLGGKWEGNPYVGHISSLKLDPANPGVYRGLAVSSFGHIYLTAQNGLNRWIQKLDSTGKIIWSKSIDLNVLDTQGGRGGIALDSTGNVYVLDTLSYTVNKFDEQGNFLNKWGSKGSGDAQFENLNGIALDAEDNVYVLTLNEVKKFDKNGRFLLKFDKKPDGTSWFSRAKQVVTLPGDLVAVSDENSNILRIFNSLGNYMGELSIGLSANTLATDKKGNLYIGNHSQFYKFNPYKGSTQSNLLYTFGNSGKGNYQFNIISSVIVHENGLIYVLEWLPASAQIKVYYQYPNS